MEIYKRNYDNPKNEDGTLKPNELLGDFEIVENLDEEEDAWENDYIGTMNGKVYLISQREVSGHGNNLGGSRFEVKELTKLCVR